MNNTEAEAADFRSDTFTMPDEAMRKIIHEAQVGNAGYGEDPSVNQLEKTLADFFECLIRHICRGVGLIYESVADLVWVGLHC